MAGFTLYTYDSTIRDNAKLYSRYMDDIFRSITKSSIDAKLAEINDLHPSLKFTIEMEKDGQHCHNIDSKFRLPKQVYQ